MRTDHQSLATPPSAVWCLLALALCGCSTFNRDWKAAAASPDPSDGVTGRWEGTWRSDVNGHTGRLRCLVAKKQSHHYRARFHATYWKVLRFGYEVSLSVQDEEGIFKFTGEADLGRRAGGVYRYQGHVTATNFFSTYHCERDHGTFQMARPEVGK